MQSQVDMADQQAPDISDRKNWPNWVKITLKWLGIGGALVGAVALVIGGLGNVWEGGSKLCAAVGLCAPGAAPPILPNLNTDWVDGGHTAGEYCRPQLAAYQQQYPIFNITMTELPNETHKNLLGHVRYKFHCAFAATPK
jgi:hypothetical protein